ncbi:hypothetical protein [Leucobacter tenebrionis]|uniref:hypothetical protein n=1 Tax=Leucobacter tenebrionis TaxID=2873270 RepID=UPI001CA6A878|nr:hypothetical protein [Leucobacter tenebrionis]QZY52275.1 hypothetical protein KVY00_02040 [Leucobacter tenebrionis]
MPESPLPQTVTTHDITEFPVKIRAPFGVVTLVSPVAFLHDVHFASGFYVEGDTMGDRAILFLVDDEEFEVV